MSRRGWVLFAAMGVIWGVPYLLIKVAVTELSPATLVLGRTVLAALLLVPLAAARKELAPVVRAWRPLTVFAFVEIAAPWWLLSHAEQHISSSLAGLLLAAVPLVSATIGTLAGERLGPRRAAGLLVGLIGVAALVGLDLGSGDTLALVEMALVAIAYAVGPFILARHLSHLPGLGVVAMSLVLTAGGYLIPGLIQLPAHRPSAEALWSLAGLALLCTAVAFVLFFALIDEVGPARATVITYVNPAVAIALGVALLDEPFTVGMALGFVLVLVGSVLATHRQPVDNS